jgi:hypothetical protein
MRRAAEFVRGAGQQLRQESGAQEASTRVSALHAGVRAPQKPKMDLRKFYQRIRGIEAEVHEEFAVIVSRTTPDGGRAGVKCDVPRAVAARLVAEEKADLASPEEAERFRTEVENKWRY